MPTEPRAILFVITRGDSLGGAQIHVRDLAVGAAARGYRVAVAVGSEGPFTALLGAAGVPVVLIPGLARQINPWADLRAVRQLSSLIHRWKPDLVACHTAKAGLVGRLAAWFQGVPAQYTVHGWQFAEGIPGAQRLVVLGVEWFLAKLTRTIITVSHYDRRLALAHGVGTPRQLVTVHNGMPLEPYVPLLRGTPSVRLVMVARFQPQKDHATLFAALGRLEDLPWTLDLVGDGPGLERWRTWVARRGWRDRVIFHGLSLDVASILRRSDLFVLSSRWEGFPNSILEAMRAGLPVVATGVGGVAEAVVDGVTGSVVPPQDPAALASALGRLIADRGLRQEWGTQGRRRFEGEFTFDTMMANTEKVWRGE